MERIKPENYFLLCPQCHGISGYDGREALFAWVRYKRTHENYSMVLRRDIKKGGGDSGSGPEPCGGAICRAAADPRLEEDAYIRDYIVKNCAMHGSFLAPLSRMMILQKWILDPEEQKKFAAWRRTLPEEETGEKEPT